MERFWGAQANLKKMIEVAFIKYDADRSGMLDREELQNALRELTTDGDSVTKVTICTRHRNTAC